MDLMGKDPNRSIGHQSGNDMIIRLMGQIEKVEIVGQAASSQQPGSQSHTQHSPGHTQRDNLELGAKQQANKRRGVGSGIGHDG